MRPSSPACSRFSTISVGSCATTILAAQKTSQVLPTERNDWSGGVVHTIHHGVLRCMTVSWAKAVAGHMTLALEHWMLLKSSLRCAKSSERTTHSHLVMVALGRVPRRRRFIAVVGCGLWALGSGLLPARSSSLQASYLPRLSQISGSNPSRLTDTHKLSNQHHEYRHATGRRHSCQPCCKPTTPPCCLELPSGLMTATFRIFSSNLRSVLESPNMI